MIVKSLAKSCKHVWSQDPAIDRESGDWERAYRKFLETGAEDDLPLKAGARPAVFTIGPLSMRAWTRLPDLKGVAMSIEVVANGLRGVDGFQVDGAPLAFTMDETPSGRRVSQRTLEDMFDPVLFGELGERIIEISRIPT